MPPITVPAPNSEGLGRHSLQWPDHLYHLPWPWLLCSHVLQHIWHAQRNGSQLPHESTCPVSWVLRTAVPFVTITKFGADIWATCQELEQLCLVVIMPKEVTAVGWNAVVFVTLCLPPWPRWDLVSALRLDGLYMPKTRCIALYFMEKLWTNGRKSRVV